MKMEKSKLMAAVVAGGKSMRRAAMESKVNVRQFSDYCESGKTPQNPATRERIEAALGKSGGELWQEQAGD